MSAYLPQTARQTVERISTGTEPWVSVGDLVDDWRRSDLAARRRMISDPPSDEHDPALIRWAAFVAAAVDQLCWESEPRIEPPRWVADGAYVLSEPWFLLPGWRLRMHQLVDTPAAFKRRNIYGGDRILSRASALPWAGQLR